jgi:hypothetical protein
MSSIYISKKQLSIISIGLMTLTRDNSAFDFGLQTGAFTEDDLYDYVDTIKTFINKIEVSNGALLTTEINFDDIDYTDCIDLWGLPIDESSE